MRIARPHLAGRLDKRVGPAVECSVVGALRQHPRLLQRQTIRSNCIVNIPGRGSNIWVFATHVDKQQPIIASEGLIHGGAGRGRRGAGVGGWRGREEAGAVGRVFGAVRPSGRGRVVRMFEDDGTGPVCGRQAGRGSAHAGAGRSACCPLASTA